MKINLAFYRTWAKKKVVRNFGGNFWGPDRNHCSIIRPEELKALLDGGHIEMVGQAGFRMKDEPT